MPTLPHLIQSVIGLVALAGVLVLLYETLRAPLYDEHEQPVVRSKLLPGGDR